MTEFMLTTVDNPFNPFTQPDEWQAYDVSHGHHTYSLLARLVRTSDQLSEADQAAALEQAMNEIVDENLSGLHTLVAEPATG